MAEPVWTIETLKALMDERFVARDESLRLQATEYERRLGDLNHAHEIQQETAHTYVTLDKYEDKLEALDSALKLALTRVDEKFDDYIRRYELRQREVDNALAIGKGAAENAQRIAEEQGRKNNRNIATATVAITLIVGLANFLSGVL